MSGATTASPRPASRQAVGAGFDRTRAALDEFQPDAVLIWGDDQYENFREDIIPPYAVLAYDDLEGQALSAQHLLARFRPPVAEGADRAAVLRAAQVLELVPSSWQER
jgi:hypothetical protein